MADQSSYPLAVAPNGACRTHRDHPALPLSAAALADVAMSVAEAGASMFHIHVRNRDGRHVLQADLYRDAMAAIKRAIGERLVIQITTEAAGRYQPEEQMAVVREVRPEAAALALRELCGDAGRETMFGEFMMFMRRERIAPQIILYDTDDVVRLIDLMGRGVVPDRTPNVLYVLGRYNRSRESRPTDLTPFLQAAGRSFPDFMVCAFGRTEAACVANAALVGGGVRVGFENNLHLPDGALAQDNAALVNAVRAPLSALGLKPISVDALRDRLTRHYP